MSKIAVIVVTYNRPKSLSRLLYSLNSAFYDGNEVDLIVSIDKSDIVEEIFQVVNNFDWQYGQKKTRTFRVRQGLRDHILQCGDFTNEYEAVIIFEDDIIAAENYYLYTKQTLEYYGKDPNIAGISLYAPTMNEMVEKPFTPIRSNADVYFIQSAQSWGQCWSKDMWKSFREWYETNNDELIQQPDMPARIYSWPESSWKKYYMKYIVETNRYFVYPYESLSTNASDVGQHVKRANSRYQVPLLYGAKEYRLEKFEYGIKYDVFFEYKGIQNINGINEKELCVDLYASRLTNDNKRYILTRKKMNYKVLRTYGLKMRPHEVNILHEVDGNDIFLYDLETSERNIDLVGRFESNVELDYNSTLTWKYALKFGLYGFIQAIISKIFK